MQESAMNMLPCLRHFTLGVFSRTSGFQNAWTGKQTMTLTICNGT